MRGLLLLAGALAAPGFAQGVLPAPGRSAQGDVSVTIYNDNLALVQDVRRVDLPGGRSRQEFPDVSAQIRAETVTLSGDGFGIVEQNFDYDLLSPSALMQKAVGEEVTLVRTNPATGGEQRERARVLAVNNGVVLQIGNRIEVLRDDGLPVRVIFDKVPPNLRARPTLSVTVEASRGGSRPLTLSYLTPGLGWQADYVTLFDRAAGRIDVQGWITLTNNTGTTFDNAETLLVAGSVQQQGGNPYAGNRRYPPPPPPPPPDRVVRPGTESADRERLGDFYLYPLEARTTIANAQQKQVSFLDVSGAPGSAGYEYRNSWLGSSEEPQSAASVIRFSTSRDQGLGDALPAGTVRVYMKDARGAAQFIGESAIGHTPMGSDLSLKTGDAFDVKVQPTVEARERLGDSRWRTTMRYTLTNARPEAVTVDLKQGGLDAWWDDTRITAESQKSERLSSSEALWRVAVPANGTATVTATFDTRY
ncbi:DUF4139 domain-containing protein [Allosphingosinicella indica]|uniref:DUF4139 domain-containing protein n=1 Tax=Allosphingosinicella indica TaxID=941907 RepID=A0A1X7G0E1_9SPHN|nr:DUF4139 domain-containing protein [Allosphingosinicella indica]SMF61832.1 hypothetical protein SAMN06295910_0832 [Allosphingosinicella indica]